jgi:hypothetical protein
MIPLVYFLVVWFVALAIFAISSFLSVMQMVRFGITGAGTFMSTLLFIGISVIVILGTSAFLLNVDWTQSIDLFGNLSRTIIFNP